MAENALALFSSDSGSTAVNGVTIVIYLVYLVAIVAANFKLFALAGEPAWACIVPFYGNYVMFKIVYGNGWKFLLMLVPILGEILCIALYFRWAKVYGRSTGFAIANLFFTPITLLIMAFDGKSSYQGPEDAFI